MKRILLLCVIILHMVFVCSASAVTIDEIKPIVGKQSCTTNMPSEPQNCATPQSHDYLIKNTQQCNSTVNICSLSMEYRLYKWATPKEYLQSYGIPDDKKIAWNGRIILSATYASDGNVISYTQVVYSNPDPCYAYKWLYFYSYNVARDGTPEEAMKYCKFIKYYKDLTLKEQKTGWSEAGATTSTTETTNNGSTTTTINNLKDCKKIRIDGDLYKLETKNLKCLKARKMAKRLYDQDKFEMDDEYMIYEKNKIVIKLTIINE